MKQNVKNGLRMTTEAKHGYRLAGFLHSGADLFPGLLIALAIMVSSAGCKKNTDTLTRLPGDGSKTATALTSNIVKKVLHYNVCGNVCWEAGDIPGGSDTRGSISPRMSTILAAIDNYQPHAITFNEICYSQYRNIRTSLISRGYGATYSSTTNGYTCDNFDSSYGTGYGNAIFFKGTTPLATIYTLPQGAGLETREMICTDVTLDGELIKLCTTHITNDATWRPVQIQEVADLASGWISSGQPVIITGDFNAEPSSSDMAPMYSHSGGSGQFQEADESNACPSPLTFCRGGESTFGQVRDYYYGPYTTKKLDYIFFSAAHFGAPWGDAKSALPSPISDHNLLQGSATWQ